MTNGYRSLRQPLGLAAVAFVNAAIRLLPHLVESVRRVPGVGVVGEIGTGQLKRSVRQVGVVGDACVWSGRPCGASRTGGEQKKIVRFQRRLNRRQLCIGEPGERWRCQAWLVRRAAQRRGGKGRVNRLVAIVDADEIARLARCRELLRCGEIRPGRAVRTYDTFRQQIQDRVAAFRNVSAVNVIKAAVFADDDDDVLDRCGGLRLICRGIGIGAMGGDGGRHAGQRSGK